MRPRRSVWFALVPAIVMMLLQNAAALFGSQILMIREFAGMDGEWNISDMMDSMAKTMLTGGYSMAVYFGYSVVAVVVFLIWYKSVAVEYGDVFTHNDRIRGLSLKLYLYIIILAIAFQYIAANIFQISAKAFPDWLDEYSELMRTTSVSGGGVATVITVIYVAILGPVVEELCFRGLTYSLARNTMPHWSANFLQAIVFGGIHNNPLQGIYAFVFALILGDIVGKTGNLCLSILIHICFNTASYVLADYIGVGETAVSFYFILLFSMIATYLSYKSIIENAVQNE